MTDPHARAQANWKSNETLVSFEDLFNGPFNYNDLSFSFVPTTATNLPGWYRNNRPEIIYDDKNSGLRIVWDNSYIYQHPGESNLYWYAALDFRNTSNQPLQLSCSGLTDVGENIRGTEGIPSNSFGSVPAE